MRERWCLRAGDREAEQKLERELGVTPLLARLLVQRGIREPDEAALFLHPRLSAGLRSPFLFRHMERAAQRIAEALEKGETIAIFGDYDVDGVAGTALLYDFLCDLGASLLVHIPDRKTEGYGLNIPAIQDLAQQGAKVLITVDCGGASHEEITAARELGMDVVICDHHQVPRQPLPALAALNPVAPDAGFPFTGLCGAGVAFYLALGIRARLRERGRERAPDLRQALDLVALGTIADVVPLVEENRVLVAHGLQQLRAAVRPGIAALKAVAGVQHLDSSAIAFRITPRLNAGGRMRHAREAFDLLTAREAGRALELAQLLDQANRERQSVEREILREVLARCRADPELGERAGLVFASEEWHAGVIGIVAARVVERLHRPTAVIAVDTESGVGRGSVRCVAGWNAYAALRDCAELLLGFGGHPMAAGLTIAADRIEDFSFAFDQAIRRQKPSSPVRTEWADAELSLEHVSEETWRDLQLLEPFGAGNPEPVFFARGVELRAFQPFGSEHYRGFLVQGGRSWPALAFRWPDANLPLAEGLYDVLYRLDLASSNGLSPARLVLLAARPASTERSLLSA